MAFAAFVFGVSALAFSGFCAWYGHYILALPPALVALRAVWNVAPERARLCRGAAGVLVVGVLAFGGVRADSWRSKKRAIVLAAEEVMWDRVTGRTTLEESAARARSWRTFAEADPGYQVSVKAVEETGEPVALSLSVGWLHWWQVRQGMEEVGEDPGAIVWRARGDDVEVVQEQLDRFLGEIRRERPSFLFAPQPSGEAAPAR